MVLTATLTWAIYGAKLIVNLNLYSKGWTGLKSKVVQMALFKCSTGVTNIWLTPQVEFKAVPQTEHLPRISAWRWHLTPGWSALPTAQALDLLGWCSGREESWSPWNIWNSHWKFNCLSTIFTWSHIRHPLDFFFLLRKRHAIISDFFPLWLKFQCQNAKACRALRGWQANGHWSTSGMQQSCPSVPTPVPLALHSSRTCECADVSGCPLPWGRWRLLSLGCFHGAARMAWMCHWLHCSSDTVKIPESFKAVGKHTNVSVRLSEEGSAKQFRSRSGNRVTGKRRENWEKTTYPWRAFCKKVESRKMGQKRDKLCFYRPVNFGWRLWFNLK